MSFPFIIWTLQGSGGPPLAELLTSISEHKTDERQHQHLSRLAETWGTTLEPEAASSQIDQMLSERLLICHYYELCPMAFNIALITAISQTDYRHIFLMRRDELSRLFSQAVAQSTEAWFRDKSSGGLTAGGRRRPGALAVANVVSQYQHCHQRTDQIRHALATHKVDYTDLYFEDIYTGAIEGRLSRLHKLLDFLAFSPEAVDAHRSTINTRISEAGSVHRPGARFIPNLRDAVDALVAAGCPSPSGGVTAWASASGWGGPRARIIAFFEEFAEAHDARGPFLELCPAPGASALLSSDCFAGTERHVVCRDRRGADGTNRAPGFDGVIDGVTLHYGDSVEMLAPFASGSFGTVISNGHLAQDHALLQTVEEMKRVLAPGGLLMLAVPGFTKLPDPTGTRAVGTKGNAIPDAAVTHCIQSPQDLWRLSPQAVKDIILDGLDILVVREAMMPPRLFGVGMKPPEDTGQTKAVEPVARASEVPDPPPAMASVSKKTPKKTPKTRPIDVPVISGSEANHLDWLDHLFILYALILRDLQLKHLGNPFGFTVELVRPTIVIIVHYYFFAAVRSSMPAHIPVESFVIAGFSVWFAFSVTYHAVIDAAKWPAGATLIPGVTRMHLRLARASWSVLLYLVFCLIAVLPLQLYGNTVRMPDLPLTVLIFLLAGGMGIGFGLVMGRLIQASATAKVPETVLHWAIFVSSGVYISVATMPPVMAKVVLYNPLIHLVEYERHAFDPGYPINFVTLSYPAGFAIGCLLIGLLVMRCSRTPSPD